MPPDTLDRLTRLRLRPGARPAFRRKLDDDGAGVAVTLPHPKDLVHALGSLTSKALFRTGSTGVVREDGTGVDLTEVARVLVSSWSALPDRADAGAVYRDLRTLARISPQRAALEYAVEVVAAWRLSLPRPPRRKAADGGPRTPPKTTQERVRSHRARAVQAEEDSGRWWLDGYLSGWGDEDQTPAPGTRVTAPALLRSCREDLNPIIERYRDEVEAPRVAPYAAQTLEERLATWKTEAVEEDGLPVRPRVPGRNRFYSLAEDVLGPSVSHAGTRVYTIPAPREGHHHRRGVRRTDGAVVELASRTPFC